MSSSPSRSPLVALALFLPFGLALGCNGNAVLGDGHSGSVAASTGAGGSAASSSSAGGGGDEPAPRVLWALATGTTSGDDLRAVAVDAIGNVYVAGSSGKQATIGEELWSVTDAYVASFDADGQPRWDRTFGDVGADHGNSIVATADAVVVSGVLDPAASGTPNQDVDLLLVSYGHDGADGWSHRFPHASAMSVTADASSNLFVAGSLQKETSLGGATLASAGSSDGAFASYAADGTPRWSNRYGDTGQDGSWSVAVSPLGNVFATGYFQGTVDLGGKPLTSEGDFDVLVTSFASDGALRWSARYGGADQDFGHAIAVDGDENVYVAGHLYSAGADLGSGPEPAAGAFVASYTSQGQPRWSRVFDHTRIYALSIGPSGDLLVAGQIDGDAQLGALTLVCAGESDAFFGRLSTAGDVIDAHAFGSEIVETALGVAEDASGDVYVVGSFDPLLTPTPTDLDGVALTSHGDGDGFLLKFGH